jgi:Sec-independent protein secretion pathway component TatC
MGYWRWLGSRYNQFWLNINLKEWYVEWEWLLFISFIIGFTVSIPLLAMFIHPMIMLLSIILFGISVFFFLSYREYQEEGTK